MTSTLNTSPFCAATITVVPDHGPIAAIGSARFGTGVSVVPSNETRPPVVETPATPSVPGAPHHSVPAASIVRPWTRSAAVWYGLAVSVARSMASMLDD